VTHGRYQLPIARILTAALIGLISAAGAQSNVAMRPLPQAISADTLRSPITPKRAFLLSLFVPGSAQSVLGRHRSAVALLSVEAAAIAMIRESGADARQARRQLGDTLVQSYVDANGDRLQVPVLERRRFENGEVQSRRSHVEDWVALLIANHLFAASDALVAASLWDVPAHITLRGDRNRFTIVGQIPW